MAQQLIMGKTVAPESFSCITVFFSDICGFTSLAATVTPIQVCVFTKLDGYTGVHERFKWYTDGLQITSNVHLYLGIQVNIQFTGI